MHRPTLILRRFGDLSIGLGWFEGDVWIDHASLAPNRPVSAAERAALDAIHSWFDCCREPSVAIPVAVDDRTPSSAHA